MQQNLTIEINRSGILSKEQQQIVHHCATMVDEGKMHYERAKR